jgi:DNA repair exonuclease SbcCD nuclease subunit
MHGVSCIDQVREYADKVDAKMVLFGGDFWHVRRNIDTAALNEGLNAVAKFSQPVKIIHGNHDQANSSGSIHAANPFKYLSNVQVIDKPGWIECDGVDILGIPYTENKDDVKQLCRLKAPNKDSVKILLAHLGIQGASVGADFVYNNEADCELKDLNSKSFDYGFLGHYHLHQQLAKNICYVGAPLQHNWGDKFQKRGFVEYDTETKKIKHIECVAPKFVEMDDVEGWEAVVDPGNYVRLISDKEYSADEREDIRQRIGARTFEVSTYTTAPEITARSTLTPNESYDKIIEKYIESKGTDLDLGVLAEMGRSILQEVL